MSECAPPLHCYKQKRCVAHCRCAYLWSNRPAIGQDMSRNYLPCPQTAAAWVALRETTRGPRSNRSPQVNDILALATRITVDEHGIDAARGWGILSLGGRGPALPPDAIASLSRLRQALFVSRNTRRLPRWGEIPLLIGCDAVRALSGVPASKSGSCRRL